MSGSSKKTIARGARRGEAARQATSPIVAELLEECRLEVLGAMKPYLVRDSPVPTSMTSPPTILGAAER